MTRQRPWSVRLTEAAEADFDVLLALTFEHFGTRQTSAYAPQPAERVQA